MARRGMGSAPDDSPLFIVKRDLSKGMNTRQQSQLIEDTQAVLLQNILLETAGQTTLREGSTVIDATYPINTTASAYYITDEDGNIVTDEDGNYFPIPT